MCAWPFEKSTVVFVDESFRRTGDPASREQSNSRKNKIRPPIRINRVFSVLAKILAVAPSLKQARWREATTP